MGFPFMLFSACITFPFSFSITVHQTPQIFLNHFALQLNLTVCVCACVGLHLRHESRLLMGRTRCVHVHHLASPHLSPSVADWFMHTDVDCGDHIHEREVHFGPVPTAVDSSEVLILKRDILWSNLTFCRLRRSYVWIRGAL